MGKGRQEFRLTRRHEFGSPYRSDRTHPACTYTCSHVDPRASDGGMKNSLPGAGLTSYVQITRCGSLSRRCRLKVRGQRGQRSGIWWTPPPHDAVPVSKARVRERLVGGASPAIPRQDKRARLDNNNPATGSKIKWVIGCLSGKPGNVPSVSLKTVCQPKGTSLILVLRRSVALLLPLNFASPSSALKRFQHHPVGNIFLPGTI